jgi:adenylate kinase family enzyme
MEWFSTGSTISRRVGTVTSADLPSARMRILITGAAGSGTSTLAQALGSTLGASVLEADDYFWLPTSPPFTSKRDPKERLSLILRDLARMPSAVIAGSIVDWGTELEDSMSMIVFLTVPAAVRVRRLRQREQLFFGRVNPDFLEWAAQYDEGRLAGRSRLKHERWLSLRSAPVLRIDGDISVEDANRRVLAALKS